VSVPFRVSTEIKSSDAWLRCLPFAQEPGPLRPTYSGPLSLFIFQSHPPPSLHQPRCSIEQPAPHKNIGRQLPVVQSVIDKDHIESTSITEDWGADHSRLYCLHTLPTRRGSLKSSSNSYEQLSFDSSSTFAILKPATASRSKKGIPSIVTMSNGVVVSVSLHRLSHRSWPSSGAIESIY
jgi:hypothetical protein